MIAFGSRRAVCHAVAFGVLLGLMTSAAVGATALPGPVVVSDRTCQPNKGCTNYYDTGTKECTGVKCSGQTTSASIKACFPEAGQCTQDESSQGSITCPGICQNATNTACGFKVTGCK